MGRFSDAEGELEGLLFWVLAVLASMAVGLSKGGLPAVALLSVPLLSLVMNPVAAAGLLLPVYVASDVFGVWVYRHEFDRRVLTIGVIGMIVGVGIGWATAHLVPERAVKGIIGVIGAAFALNIIARRGRELPAKPIRKGQGLFWTAIAGFTSFVSHSGGPPWQVWVLPLKLSKMAFAGTSTIAFAVINLVKLVPYGFLGQLNPANLKVAAILMIPASLSVFAGLKLVRILPEALFFKIVTWALLAISLKLIWDGAFGG